MNVSGDIPLANKMKDNSGTAVEHLWYLISLTCIIGTPAFFHSLHISCKDPHNLISPYGEPLGCPPKSTTLKGVNCVHIVRICRSLKQGRRTQWMDFKLNIATLRTSWLAAVGRPVLFWVVVYFRIIIIVIRATYGLLENRILSWYPVINSRKAIDVAMLFDKKWGKKIKGKWIFRITANSISLHIRVFPFHGENFL